MPLATAAVGSASPWARGEDPSEGWRGEGAGGSWVALLGFLSVFLAGNRHASVSLAVYRLSLAVLAGIDWGRPFWGVGAAGSKEAGGASVGC